MMDDLQDDERELHTLFGALRRHVVRISDGLWSRLDHRLDEDVRPVDSVSHTKVAASALLEILNLLTRLVASARERPTEPARKEPDSSDKRGE